MIDISFQTGFTILSPLVMFVLGMVIYSIFIFNFDRFIATRDILAFNLYQYHDKVTWIWLRQFVYVIMYLLEYIIIFPFFIMTWFFILAFFLLILSENNVEMTLVIAMAIVTTIRITAYYNYKLSEDLAKTLPLALLVVMLTNVSSFSIDKLIDGLSRVPLFFNTILYYIFFVMSVELFLRIITLLYSSEK